MKFVKPFLKVCGIVSALVTGANQSFAGGPINHCVAVNSEVLTQKKVGDSAVPSIALVATLEDLECESGNSYQQIKLIFNADGLDPFSTLEVDLEYTANGSQQLLSLVAGYSLDFKLKGAVIVDQQRIKEILSNMPLRVSAQANGREIDVMLGRQ